MTRALILAAGRGSRLGELTKNRPKPTLEIGGKTVLQHIIDNLYRHNVFEIIINCHYLPLIITEKVGTKALYFYEEVLLGHDGTISALSNWLKDDDFYLINGDTISNVDLTDMRHKHAKGTITVLMDSWRCAGTWLYSWEYFNNNNLPVIPYRPNGLIWHDIGTMDRLDAAKKYYEL